MGPYTMVINYQNSVAVLNLSKLPVSSRPELKTMLVMVENSNSWQVFRLTCHKTLLCILMHKPSLTWNHLSTYHCFLGFSAFPPWHWKLVSPFLGICYSMQPENFEWLQGILGYREKIIQGGLIWFNFGSSETRIPEQCNSFKFSVTSFLIQRSRNWKIKWFCQDGTKSQC